MMPQENMQTRRESFGLKTKYQANDDQTICNKKAPLPGALRYYLEEKERSVDLGFIHRFKSINNALEVESHTSECMPEMPLEEEECEVEVSVCKPGPCSVSVTGKN